MATWEQIQALINEGDTVLTIVGTYAAAAARRAIIDETDPTTGEMWPARYPNQGGESFNVAGALSDLQQSPNVKARRYNNRPTGRDTGEMLRRITFEVRGDTVVIGSDVPYATLFQEGGVSSITIDSNLRRNLAQFLRKQRRAAKKRARDGDETVSIGPRGGIRTMEAIRLGPVFNVGTMWTTEHVPRQFVGLSKRDEADLAEELLAAAERMPTHANG